MNRFTLAALLLMLPILGIITLTTGAQSFYRIETEIQGPSLIPRYVPVSQPLSENPAESKRRFEDMGVTFICIGVLLGFANLIGIFDTKKIARKRRTR